jgi:mannosyltransferase OCH1-like enzyme
MNKVVILIVLAVLIYLYIKRDIVVTNIRNNHNVLFSSRQLAPKLKVENRKPALPASYTQKIPLKFHQTDNSRMVDYAVYKATRLNQRVNPEYEYLFYDEQDRRDFITQHFPQYMKHYDSIIPGAYKADLFRLLVLYQEGGVYLDSKCFCIASLREMIKPTDDVYMIRDVMPGCIQNGFMSSIPGHPLIKSCIDRYVSNIEKRHYGLDMFDIGGPRMVGRMLNTFLGKSEEEEILPVEKDGVRVAGHLKVSASGEIVVVSEEDDIYIERANKAYQKRKIKDVLTGKCYGLKWFLGTVYQ